MVEADQRCSSATAAPGSGFVGGLGDLASLQRSQLVSVLPDWATRAAVTVKIGLGLGLALAALARLRRRSGREPAASRDGAG